MFCTFAHSSLIIWYMLYYIKKYPVSLFIILTVIYLSFFKPPSTEISKIPNYRQGGAYLYVFRHVRNAVAGVSSRSPERQRPFYGMHGQGAFVCPVLFSGMVELLQEYCTTYRGGDWLDLRPIPRSGACINGRLFYLRPRMK